MCGHYLLTHLSDQTLLRGLAERLVRECGITAEVLAYLAEVDARRLYAPAGYSSMYDFCVQELHLSEDAASKRIRAARAALQFPAIFAAVADGGLHLSGVVMLAPHLTPEMADELLGVAAHKTKSEIEQLLAQRFPQPELPARIQALSPPPTPMLSDDQLAPGPVGAPGELSAPGRIETLVERPKVKPLAPQLFAVQFTMGQATNEKLRYVQALLGHQLPSWDVAEVFDRSLDAFIEKLEKRKFAATSKPLPSQRRRTANPHIPAAVKRAVWERDGGRCTFVSDAGQRCAARSMLEFDHIEPVARGGQATVPGIRLRCRSHNQYAAECAFGTEFMRHKREEARRAAAEARTKAAEAKTRETTERAQASAAAEQVKRDVIAALRNLGYRADMRAGQPSTASPCLTQRSRSECGSL